MSFLEGSNHGGAGSRKEGLGKPNLTGTEIHPGWIHPRQGFGLVGQWDFGLGGIARKVSARMAVGLRPCKPPRLRPRQTGWASAQTAEGLRPPRTVDSSTGHGVAILQPEDLRITRSRAVFGSLDNRSTCAPPSSWRGRPPVGEGQGPRRSARNLARWTDGIAVPSTAGVIGGPEGFLGEGFGRNREGCRT